MAITKKIEKIANRLKGMSHPARLQILEELLETKEGYNVTTIQKLLKIPQSAISQHLAKLRLTDILGSNRNGVEIFYYIKDEKTRELIRNIFSL